MNRAADTENVLAIIEGEKKMVASSENCTCVSCPECQGSGSVWRSFRGTYLGNNRCDDLDELETCPECNGRGLSEMCDYCREMEEEDERLS